MAEQQNVTDYLPWDWTIRAIDPNKTCPSSSQILGTFAWVNIFVSFVSAIVGHRAVTLLFTRILLCRRASKKADSDIPLLSSQSTFGKPKSGGEKVSQHYYWTWIFPFGLSLGANAVNAYLMRRAKGYETTYSILEMTMFLAVRPRLGAVFVSFLDWVAGRRGAGIDADNGYRAAAISSMFAELGLQGVALYTTGRTVHLASKNHYFGLKDHARFSALSLGVKMMYAGALTHVIGAPVVIYSFAWIVRYAKPRRTVAQAQQWFMCIVMLEWPYIACWVFLAGYVRVVGDLYCPPDLASQGGVWASFSIVGMMISGIN